LNTGTDPAELSSEDRRALINVSAEEYRNGRLRRYGASNPEEIREPFWEAMIRAGISAYQAEQLYLDRVGPSGSPVSEQRKRSSAEAPYPWRQLRKHNRPCFKLE
jgi:hypothetical protein